MRWTQTCTHANALFVSISEHPRQLSQTEESCVETIPLWKLLNPTLSPSLWMHTQTHFKQIEACADKMIWIFENGLRQKKTEKKRRKKHWEDYWSGIANTLYASQSWTSEQIPVSVCVSACVLNFSSLSAPCSSTVYHLVSLSCPLFSLLSSSSFSSSSPPPF